MKRSFRTSKVLTIRPAPLTRASGILTMDGIALPVAIGRNGVTSRKREGDGCTPRGHLKMLYGFYRADRGPRPQGPLPFYPLRPQMGWCDVPSHGCYNRKVTLPFAASHERLWRRDHLYDIIVVLDWNVSTRAAWRGSAIFIHLKRDDGGATEGCVALTRRDMLRLLSISGPETYLRL